jgi:hypothetical protein
VRFSFPVVDRAGTDPVETVAVDLNGDAKPDLATVDESSNTVSVLLGTGTGSFRKRIAYKTAPDPERIIAGDVDHDGDPDVVTASVDTRGSVTVFVNQRGRLRRAKTYTTGRRAFGVAMGDIDADGKVDLVTAHNGPKPLTVLLGKGAARFRVAHHCAGTGADSVALADFNTDGKLDVAATTTRSSIAVRLGRGDGTFGPARAYKSGRSLLGITVADLNHDDKPDIAAAAYEGGSVWVHLGVGDGTFAPGTRYRMSDGQVDSVLVADLDDDGILDIATPEDGGFDEADFSGANVRRGRGDGTFDSPQEIAGGRAAGTAPTVGGAVADFNHDGRPDLAFSEGTDLVGSDYDPPPSHQTYVFLNWTGLAAPPCIVYDASHVPLRIVARGVRRTGCRVGRVRRRFSRTVRKGRVISQHPAPGAVLPSHGRVNFVVSRGRRR